MLDNHFTFIDKLKNRENLSWEEIAESFNSSFGQETTKDALRKKYRRELHRRENIGGDSLEKALRIIKKEPIKPTELARRLGLDINGLESLLDDFQNTRAAIKFQNEYLVWDKAAPTPEDKEIKLNVLTNKNGYLKIGMIADTHMCSVHEEFELLCTMYKIFEEEKVEFILHGGDFTAGGGTVYKGQHQELAVFGADRQENYVVANYPYAGVKTYCISGNHDEDYYKTAGIDILQRIAEKREDIVYLGRLGAYLNINGIKIYLGHGEGGVPHALSYKSQKFLDGLDDTPDVVVFGHWHVFSHLPAYKGAVSILPGCLEGQSSYLKRKGYSPDIGGVILSLKTEEENGEKTIVRQTVDFINLSKYSKGGVNNGRSQ